MVQKNILFDSFTDRRKVWCIPILYQDRLRLLKIPVFLARRYFAENETHLYLLEESEIPSKELELFIQI